LTDDASKRDSLCVVTGNPSTIASNCPCTLPTTMPEPHKIITISNEVPSARGIFNRSSQSTSGLSV
jgi:hypothetical protein